MTLSDAAASFAKLVATDTEFFADSVEACHNKLAWQKRKRAQAHKFVDILFDGLDKAAGDELVALLKHTQANGLVTIENIEQVKGTENVRLDDTDTKG